MECHGLQCGFCTPGFVTTVTAFLRDNPDPTEEEAREAIGGNLCRCTGYQNIVKSVLRAAELLRAEPARPLWTVTHDDRARRGRAPPSRPRRARAGAGPVRGSRSSRKEDLRLAAGDGRYLDDLGHHALAAAFLRSPHAHARIVDIDITDALDVDGLVAIYTYEDLDGRVAEPLPLLIPHPALHAPKTGYPLANGVVHHVGEAVAMVVATDRYVAEDAVERIRVEWEVLPAVVGLDAAFAADARGAPGRPRQRRGPHGAGGRRRPGRDRRRAAPADACSCMWSVRPRCRWRARASTPAGTPTTGRCGSTARPRRRPRYGSRSPRSSNLPVDRVEVVTPDVGGGFGVKIMHPWPEEVLVPWAAIRLRREVKWVEDRREHFISSAHERAQEHTVRVGFDDDGRILGLDVRFLHDNGAYTPYGIIVPIITSTQLLGPYKLGRLPGRVPLALHQHGHRHAVPRRRPGARLLRDGAGDGRRGRPLWTRPGRGPADQHDPARRDAVRPGADLPGRAAAHLRHRRLPGVAAQGAGAGRLGRLRSRCATRPGPRAGGSASGWRPMWRVRASGPYEGAHVRVETTGDVVVSTGLTTQGQGHETVFAQIAAQELGVPVERVTVTTGDTRRFKYGVGTFASRAAVMSGNAVAIAARKVRAKALRIAAAALGRRRESELSIVDGVGLGARASRPTGPRIALATVAVLANPLRYAFDEEAQAGDPVRHARPATGRRCRKGEEPGLEATGWYSPIRSTFANGVHAAVVETDPETAEIKVLRYCVVHDCGTDHQPDDRRGPGARRRGPGRRRRAVRAHRLRRVRPAGQRVLYGLPDAVRVRGADRRDRPPHLAVAAEPVGRQGSRRGRRDPGARRDRLGGRGRGGDPDRPDADLAVGAVRAAPPPRRRRGSRRCAGDRLDLAKGLKRMKLSGEATLHHPVARRLRRADRPGRAGAHDPRLPAAGADRAGHLQGHRRGRGRLDQGHLRRRRAPVRPGRAGLLHAARLGCGRPGHGERGRPGDAGRRRDGRHPAAATTPTPRSAA